MTAEDEFRKVAEDVRELARVLRAEFGAAREQARDRAAPCGPRDRWHPPDPARYQGLYYRPRRPSARQQRFADPPAPGAVAAPTWSPPAPRRRRSSRSRHERPPVRHRRDGSTLISVLLVLVGLAWLGSQSGLLQISTETVLAAVLVLLGAAMVITARTDWALSRRIWPVVVGAVVLSMLLVNTSANAIQDRLTMLQFGPQARVLTAWPDAATTIDNFAGPVRIDLSSLTARPGDPDETMRISAVAGPIDVTVPAHPAFHVHLTAQSAFGTVRIDGAASARNGFTTRTVDLGAGQTPQLSIDISSRAGPVTVREVGP